MTAGKDKTPNKSDSSDSNKMQRRSIRFHGRVQYKSIRHVSEFSEYEIRNGWYDKDDFNRMSENVAEIAKLVGNGETRAPDGEVLCIRGLEHIVQEELADYRAEKMINSIDAVLDEQEEQWDEEKEEPELIAELYAEYAKPLAREAHLLGLKDAEEGYKSWDDLIQEQTQTHTHTQTGTSSRSMVAKTEKNKTPKKKKKKKIKKIKSRQKEEKDEDDEDDEKSIPTSPSSCADGSPSLSSLSSLPSLNSSSSSSLRSFNNGGSGSSIASLSLNDPKHSISEQGDKGLPLPTKNNSMLLKAKPKQQQLPIQLNIVKKDKNNNTPTAENKKKQRKTQPRRSLLDRKHGTELSPFVFRRDGTITFRKSNVEKLKREQKEKRRNCIHGSLAKFLHNDEEAEDEDDILAGILSSPNKSKKASISSRF